MEREIQQRIFIAGASSGIGKALAERYAAHGATLGLIARREPDLKQLAPVLSNCIQGPHFCYVWDGSRITTMYEKTLYAKY